MRYSAEKQRQSKKIAIVSILADCVRAQPEALPLPFRPFRVKMRSRDQILKNGKAVTREIPQQSSHVAVQDHWYFWIFKYLYYLLSLATYSTDYIQQKEKCMLHRDCPLIENKPIISCSFHDPSMTQEGIAFACCVSAPSCALTIQTYIFSRRPSCSTNARAVPTSET